MASDIDRLAFLFQSFLDGISTQLRLHGIILNRINIMRRIFRITENHEIGSSHLIVIDTRNFSFFIIGYHTTEIIIVAIIHIGLIFLNMDQITLTRHICDREIMLVRNHCPHLHIRIDMHKVWIFLNDGKFCQSDLVKFVSHFVIFLSSFKNQNYWIFSIA